MISLAETRAMLAKLKSKKGDVIITGVKPNGWMFTAKVLDIRGIDKDKYEILMDRMTEKGYLIGYVEAGKFNSFNQVWVKDQANESTQRREKNRKTVDVDDVDGIVALYKKMIEEGKI